MPAPSRPSSAIAICAAASVSVACLQTHITAPQAQDPLEVVASQSSQQVQVRLGETFVVHSPTEAVEWELDFAPEILQLLTQAERARAPGPAGWQFRAVGVGASDLMITAVVTVGAAPAPPRRVVTVHVR
jgi:hypothetical protein